MILKDHVCEKPPNFGFLENVWYTVELKPPFFKIAAVSESNHITYRWESYNLLKKSEM